MTQYTLAAVHMHHLSGLTKDEVVNSWVFSCDDVTDPTLELVEAALEKFYTHAYTTSGFTHSVGQYLSSVISRSAHPTTKFYLLNGHLDGSAHGSPIKTRDWTTPLTDPSATVNMPTEVACALSFHADYAADVEFVGHGPGSTRPRARDRGRIYLGPFNTDAVTQDSTLHRPTPNGFMRDAMRSAAADLVASGTTWKWGVWSRKNATVKNVVGGWIDDKWDVQERRGEDATARSPF